MSDVGPDRSVWGTCPGCGDAVGPKWNQCPTCGEQFGVTGPAPAEIRRRTRIRWLTSLRSLVLVVAIASIAVAIAIPVLSGSPTLPDPLTLAGTYTVGPGNMTYFAGIITGEDYILGNYSVISPFGSSIGLSVYNNTEFASLVHHGTARAAWSAPPAPSGRIVFAAPYTDDFFFVFVNPYPASSGVELHVFVATNYQTNVVIG